MAKKQKNKTNDGTRAADAAKKKGGRETTKPEDGQVRREGLHTRDEVNRLTSPQGKNP